jgi:hypothetical protein
MIKKHVNLKNNIIFLIIEFHKYIYNLIIGRLIIMNKYIKLIFILSVVQVSIGNDTYIFHMKKQKKTQFKLM